jgi:hypothetical protein
MEKDKLIEELADDILQEFASSYSEADQDCLERMIHDAWCIKQTEVVRKMQARLKARLNDLARMDFGGATVFLVGYEYIDKVAEEMLKGEGQ